MRTKISLILLSCLLLAFDSCKKENTSNQRASTPPSANSSSAPASANKTAAGPQPPSTTVDAAAKALVDACSLVTAQEIESVQKEKVSNAKGSTRTDDGALAASQCFYTLPTFNKSVSLEVMQSHPDQPDPDILRNFWKERFREAQDKKKSDKPRSVTGVGEEAYWVGNDKAGALYVLKNDRIIRISIGGADDVEVKLKKSKSLAENAVKRL